MGFSIPAAIAVKLACPRQRVISLVGDGGFVLDAQELATAGRLGLPFVVVIFHDGALGLIQEAQRRVYPAHPLARRLATPDFAHLAQAFAMEYVAIENDEEIQTQLAKAIGSDRAVIVDVRVRYDRASRYVRGAAQAAFGQMPWDRKARCFVASGEVSRACSASRQLGTLRRLVLVPQAAPSPSGRQRCDTLAAAFGSCYVYARTSPHSCLPPSDKQARNGEGQADSHGQQFGLDAQADTCRTTRNS